MAKADRETQATGGYSIPQCGYVLVEIGLSASSLH